MSFPGRYPETPSASTERPCPAGVTSGLVSICAGLVPGTVYETVCKYALSFIGAIATGAPAVVSSLLVVVPGTVEPSIIT